MPVAPGDRLLHYRIVEKLGDAALDLLEGMLERPSDVSIAKLRLDPRWGELTQSPRFAELERRFDSP